MKRFLFVLFAVFISSISFAQLSGNKYIPGSGGPDDYPTIAAAIEALNSNGINGPVIFNIEAGYTETAPHGGFLLGSFVIPNGGLNPTTSETNTITFRKSGTGANPLITAFTPGTSEETDGIWKIQGTDYVIIDGINLQENALNTTRTMQMEWGYALVKLSSMTPDGCRYVTIKNCTITMNRANNNAVGIYTNNHTATSTSQLFVNSAPQFNSYCKIFSNSITNAYHGIYMQGGNSLGSGSYDINNEVGVDGANSITNFGGGTSSVYGVFALNQSGIKIANNTINGGGTTSSSSVYGIKASTGINPSIYNNTITCTINGVSGSSLYGIGCSSTGTLVNIYGNTILNSTITAAGSNNIPFSGIINESSSSTYPTTLNIYSNSVYNNSTTGTGPLSGIRGGYATNLNIYGNAVYGNTKNNYGSLTGLYVYSAAASLHDNMIYSNTISPTVTTASTCTMYGIFVESSPASEVFYNNQIYDLNISGLATATNNVIVGIRSNLVSNSVTTRNFYENTIRNLSIASGSGSITGISCGNSSFPGSTIPCNIYRNQVYGLSAAGTSGFANGITVPSGNTVNIYNNFVSDLKTPAATSSSAINGINITGGTTVNAYYNTVYLDASSTGSSFGSSGLYKSASTTSDLRNNCIVNLSVPGSSGSTVAFRWSGSYNAAQYNMLSNNNNWYAGTPGSSRLIFYDGTNSDQTLAAFQTRVAPRDAASVTENPPFANLVTTPYDLHMQTDVATLCESTGTPVSSPIAITNDFDGNTRNSFPDIGADEFAGLAASVINPGAFTAGVVSSVEVSLTFVLNPSGNNVVIAWNTTGVFTSPSGTPPAIIGDPFAGGVLLSNGIISPVNHTGLTPGTTYYYKAYSWDGSAYSPGVTASATPFVAPPTNFVATVFSSTQVDLTWTKNAANQDVLVATNNTAAFGTPVNGTSYTAGAALPTAGTVIYAGPASGFNHTGLTTNAIYYYKAWSVDALVNYSTGVTANAIPTLFPPTAFTATAISGSQINLAYTKNADGNDVLIATNSTATFGAPADLTAYSAGNALPTAGSVIYVGPASGFSHTNLAASTTYYYKIWSVNALNYYSATGATANATTPCGATSVFPYNEGFESGYTDGVKVVGCWTQETTGSNFWIANNTQTSYYRSPRTGAWDAYLRYGGNTWLIRKFTLTGGQSYDVSCWARQDMTNTTYASMEIKYGTTGTAAGMTNLIAPTTGLNQTYTKVSGSFTPTVSGDYYIGFHGVINASYPYYLTLDDIQVDLTSLCPPPTNLTASGVTANSESLGWTSTTGTNFDIEIGPAGFTPTGNPTYMGVTNPFTVSGLSANTSYAYYVRSNCPGSLQSSWAGPMTFTTLCAATTVPFTENFETYTPPQVGCGTVIDVNADGVYWKSEVGNAYDGTKNLKISYSASGVTEDDWYITQGISLTGGQSYEVKFWYRSASNYSERLEVKWGSAPSVAGMTSTPIFSRIDFISFSYLSGTGVITPPTTGTYYVGWHCFSPGYMGGILLDGITITPAAGLATVTTDAVSSITATTAMGGGNVTSDGGATVTARGVCWGTGPDPVITGNHTTDGTGTGTFTSSISGLLPNTLYHVRAYASNSVGNSYGQDVTFVTLPDPTINGPTNVCVSSTGNVYTTEAGNTAYTWVISAGGTVTAGGGTNDNSVTVTWVTAGPQSVSVNYNNSAGSPAPLATVFSVTVNPLPDAAGIISGLATVVQGQTGIVYSVAPITGATGYSWIMPGGASVIAGENTNSITVNFSSSATSGVMTVTGTNGCGFGPVSPGLNITVTPSVPISLIIENEVVTGNKCYNATETITVAGGNNLFTVMNGGSATFIAGQTIYFLAGTTVQSGGFLHGYIAPGGPYCSNTKIGENTMGMEDLPTVISTAFFSIYPNPTNGNFTVEQKGEMTYGKVKVEVYNMSGEKMLNESVIGQKRHEFRFAEMPSGLYFVKIVADDHIETIKLIKTK